MSSEDTAVYTEETKVLAEAWWEAMLAGDLTRAWDINDRVRAIGAPDPHRMWNGEDVTGKRVMVRCLHGFGDSIQFLRYIPQLRARAASVCVEVAPHFVELARCLEGVDHVITWGDAAPDPAPEYEVQMEVMELPYVFRTHLAALPLATRYLQLPSRLTLRSLAPRRSQGTRRLQVGLMWTAGEWNRSRGFAFDLLQPLLTLADCDFWSLSDKPAPCGVGAVMHDDTGAQISLVALAERIAQLDLVITVDTLAAHLAGAMGVPGWLLLQRHADWRWMSERDDSPWYPSLRLFRQTKEGDWHELITRVAQALRNLSPETLLPAVQKPENLDAATHSPGPPLGPLRRLSVRH